MWVHTEIDADLSLAIATQIDAQPKACWRNAWRGLPLVRNPNRLYCEGWAVVNGISIEHGWIESPGGIVVDPTLCLQSDWLKVAPVYFPGERFGLDLAIEIASSVGGDLPLVKRWGAGGYAYPHYKRAFDDSLLYATTPSLHIAPVASPGMITYFA